VNEQSPGPRSRIAAQPSASAAAPSGAEDASAAAPSGAEDASAAATSGARGDAAKPSSPQGEDGARERREPPERSEGRQLSEPPERSEGQQLSEPRQRLHPLSPLLHGTRLLFVMVVAISWQGLGQLGLWRWAALVVVLLVGAVLYSLVSWLMTGYHVIGRELRVYEGVLSRRTRAIPLERLQAVEVVRPVLARLAGLSELRLEVVGGSKTEAPLAFLTVADAVALRERLLALSGRTPALSTPAAPSAAPTVGATRLIHVVRNEDVFVGQLLTPQLWFVPIALAFVVIQFAFEGSWTFIGIASTITALVGVILQPARRVVEDWNFRLSRDEAGLRVRHGLLETRSQTVPPNRVQAIGVTWPLLWRPKRWLRCRMDIAGYAAEQQRERTGRSDRLLPVGDLDTARRIVPEALPGVDLLALRLTLAPRRARWLAPLRRRVLGAGLTDRAFAVTDGLLTRELVVVPYARIQSVRVVQGPLQRRLRLATVHADTAGGLRAVAHERDVGEAWTMAAELTDRARAARGEG
jgi:putative membrane protein